MKRVQWLPGGFTRNSCFANTKELNAALASQVAEDIYKLCL